MPSIKLLDLPLDIILLITPFLDVQSFLALSATCKALHTPNFIENWEYWSKVVRHDFRVPNQPVVENDGLRWMRLYRRMKTQSKVYTWGNNDEGCLGQSFENPMPVIRPRFRQAARQWTELPPRCSKWPGEVQGLNGLGIISDVQCGGWSTNFLTSKGEVFSFGTLDQLNNAHLRMTATGNRANPPVRLRFPDHPTPPSQDHGASTSIRQMSAGRAHLLGLSDNGRIWSWYHKSQPGIRVRFLQDEHAKKVIAGWDKSAALVDGVGIVIWEPVTQHDHEDGTDTTFLFHTAIVPETGNKATSFEHHGSAIPKHRSKDGVGEVLNVILLERLVIFTTSLGNVFAALIEWNDGLPEEDSEQPKTSQIYQLPLPGAADSDEVFATDVQGSFRSFAVFTKSGAVHTSHQDRVTEMLQHFAGSSNSQSLFKQIPALQNKGVISVAFGDYHFHALHSSGYITSYGKEPRSCGALGLGADGTPECRLRGIKHQGIGGDASLVPHAYTEGRRVWFEKDKREWISFLTSGGVDPNESRGRIRMAIGSPGDAAQGEVSEWVEQQGRDWEQKYNVTRTDDDDGLDAYFALSVSAAGWHSGALVLVNEDLAQRVRAAVEIPTKSLEQDSTPETPSEPTPSVAATSSESSTAALLEQVGNIGRNVLDYAGLLSRDVRDPIAARERESHRGEPSPINYGASPREGVDYIWARDHFPRLKLSDGTDMPGEVEFDDWRYGRPEWKLDWDSNQAT